MVFHDQIHADVIATIHSYAALLKFVVGFRFSFWFNNNFKRNFIESIYLIIDSVEWILAT